MSINNKMVIKRGKTSRGEKKNTATVYSYDNAKEKVEENIVIDEKKYIHV